MTIRPIKSPVSIATEESQIKEHRTKFTMAANQADPESIGAGPPSAAPAASGIHRDHQSFFWSRVQLSHESARPRSRSGAASVVVQGKLYMFGVG